MRHYETLCQGFREKPVPFKDRNPSNYKSSRNAVSKEAVVTNVTRLGLDLQVSRLLLLKQMNLRCKDVVDHNGFQDVYFSYFERRVTKQTFSMVLALLLKCVMLILTRVLKKLILRAVQM